MAQDDAKPASSSRDYGGPVTLRDRYEIDPGKPLPTLDMPNAHAFACVDKRNTQRALYALICDGPMPPRLALMRTLRGVTAQGLMPLVEWGAIDWVPVNGRAVAVVYDRPLGGRVMKNRDEVFQPVSEQQFNKLVTRPLLTALQELKLHSVVHRAIRPTNLYWMDAEQTRIALGDCTTSPPAYDQPGLFETIESLMANPEGRGAGYYPNDLYALGATLLILSVGRDPSAGVTDAEVLRTKIAAGSYAAVVGEERAPLGVIEVVRGLLGDDPEQRWTIDSVEHWLNGRRTNPLQTRPEKRSQRPFSFRGEEYYTRRSLAHAMASDWEAGAEAIIGGKVEIWLRRGLELSELADSVANIVRASNASAKDAGQARDMAMAAVLTLMDPTAPIRYNKTRFHVEAIGLTIACILARKGDVRPIIELVMRDFIKTWAAAQESFSTDLGRFDTEFRDMRSYLVQTAKGGGVERCLYELNETLPCRSPLVRDQAVLEIRDLLPALERAATRVDAKTHPIDRHIAAYVAARYPRDTISQIHALNDADPRKAALGLLSLLAVLQWKMGPESVPNLAGWLSTHMTPVLESYHSRERRRRIEKDMPKVIRKGSLPELYHLLDDPEERQADLDDFTVARQQYAQAAQQIAALESGNYKVSESSEKLGQQTASSLAVAICLVTIAFVFLTRIL